MGRATRIHLRRHLPGGGLSTELHHRVRRHLRWPARVADRARRIRAWWGLWGCSRLRGWSTLGLPYTAHNLLSREGNRKRHFEVAYGGVPAHARDGLCCAISGVEHSEAQLLSSTLLPGPCGTPGLARTNPHSQGGTNSAHWPYLREGHVGTSPYRWGARRCRVPALDDAVAPSALTPRCIPQAWTGRRALVSAFPPLDAVQGG